MAKDLVRTRQHVKKFIMMKANIQAVALKVQTLKSQDAMAQAMKGVTRAMRSMNRQLNLPQIQKIMSDFERQSEIMEMKEEMMSDAIDDAMGEGDEEEETEQVVQQSDDRSMSEDLNKLPTAADALNNATREGQRQPQASMAVVAGGSGGNNNVGDVDADLQARLENLRRE
uniref:Uncharacterized protein n=1 Tax=Meloidogyne incognita TaxID=6306 RepID=A0A914NW86_MELIC